MADNPEQQQQQQAQPAEKKKEKSLQDRIAEEWSSKIAMPVIAAGIAAAAGKVAGIAASVAGAGFGLGYLIEQHVKKEGNPEIKTEKLPIEVATGAGLWAGILYGSKLASGIPKLLGLEGAVAGAFGSLGNIGLGAATFGLLTLGLPLLYYPVSHILNEGTVKGMWKDLKENYFKNSLLKIGVNTIASLAVMDAYSGYTWASYLASVATPYATSLASLIAPYASLLASPALLLGIGAGLGALGLYMGYRLAFSREKISILKLAVSPFVGLYHLGAGVVKTAYNAAIGALSLGYTAAIGAQDLGLSTTRAMLGAVPAPAGKKGH